jgi:hypothetical protein
VCVEPWGCRPNDATQQKPKRRHDKGPLRRPVPLFLSLFGARRTEGHGIAIRGSWAAVFSVANYPQFAITLPKFRCCVAPASWGCGSSGAWNRDHRSTASARGAIRALAWRSPRCLGCPHMILLELRYLPLALSPWLPWRSRSSFSNKSNYCTGR